MEDIIYIKEFLKDNHKLFALLNRKIIWDERMTARKTASFGKAYNYSQMSYPEAPFLGEIRPIIDLIKETLSFEPNNCLINYYMNGQARMGWYSDQTDVLVSGTGVVIISLGGERILKFRKINAYEVASEYLLASGSLIYMSQKIQEEWQHCIPKSNIEQARMSLTFRKLL
ncbi:alpha-ketoglutarate-dependent dioxygenase AlkB [Acinetobacter guillouiae]|uniref:alpha-ketoglutarate-dependent dioxygenase AlkB n=1 Tax=Acinetobacter TaxID=469 RepID=UPI001FB94C58|nr:alpha-ketoglutarate-dependent dioxygenase AlkB [Acinetobacter sp. NyZ410]UOH18212.1 alpha-ketoglutarate-dependent dioxygenase AlkB [Acinetobacter sp. NyZ410]